MRIAVVIPARNEAERLAQAIDTIRARGRADRIIVLDCASTDDTRAVAAAAGIPEVDLLEDVVLCRRLLHHGRLRLARGRMITSPRRFIRHGPIRQALLDLLLVTAGMLRLRPQRLHAWYNRDNAEA